MKRKLASLTALTTALFLIFTGAVLGQDNEQTVVTLQEQIPVHIEVAPPEDATDSEPLSFTVILSVTKSAVLDGSAVVSSSVTADIVSTDAPADVLIPEIPKLAVTVTADTGYTENETTTDSKDPSTPQAVEGTVNRNSNLREGPGTSFAVVRSVPKGTVLKIVGGNADNTWVQLSTGEWIAAFLVDGLPDGLPDAGSATEIAPSDFPQLTTEDEIIEDSEEALAVYTAQIETDPNDSDAYFNRGVIYGKMANLDASLSDFDRVIELQPDYAAAFFNRAFVHTAMGNRDEALDDLGRAIELDPSVTGGYALRAMLYFDDEEYDLALTDVDHAIILDPDNGYLYYLRTQILTRLGEFENAIATLDELLEQNPDDTSALFHRAKAYALSDQLEEAILDMDRAIDLDPDTPSLYSQRGLIYGLMDNYEAAVADYNKVIELNPGDVDAYLDRALNFAYMGEFDKALQDVGRAIELDPDDYKAYELQGRVLKSLRDYEAAIDSYDRAIELNPEADDSFRGRGIIYRALDRFDDALDDFNTSIALNPFNVDSYYDRASFYQFEMKDLDKAEADYESMLELAPYAIEAYNNRALLLIELGRFEEAMSDMEACAKYSEDGLSSHVLDTRGYVYLRTGDYESSIADYESAIDAGLDIVYTQLGLGVALAENGDLERAMPLLEEGMAEAAEFEELDAQLTYLYERAQEIVEGAAE